MENRKIKKNNKLEEGEKKKKWAYAQGRSPVGA